MKIYVCHSSGFDFRKELYEPIRNSFLNTKHEFIFPHEKSNEVFNSKEVIPTCDLVIAEISYPSTGLGIELGWANKDKKRIVLIYRKGSKVSRSLRIVSNDFTEYSNEKDLIKKLESALK
ncbi:hypothetical protein A3F32_01245 [Candidatus Roizmanbacteria bacterium RIFCSPHIGHO2_12_FULL_42_10]|uniref:2'-deoxynucleoside 5'-phosphate N-hydrolase 1 n=3 Tax=Candidatus Roizmaniibacteriota TaxID=1752723 RepID=A0A1F7GFZ3_9BACT|nr:MAG: hypothetical protein A2866_02135 [Candidatus Roizmanbacteria bacterium RIFCSPHIGHO2_01_FULL_39_8]OGK25800.1 MAG: hypothetical protein A3C28_00745 [Candidatus Roizmanbacteria bacterium RIFCSPHIGHO2_02_FULL_39_9]OGK38283.1 MAG: hypothetical protein A3F32_01245 [Candidatus Roizmanbacteria bacterium RIFCSPHIGHO2_12_FULL_42_10]